jgi:predicted nucleic acid-binding protein
MIVIDASAVLEILKRTATGLELIPVVAGREQHAPHLIDLEVANALRRWEAQGEMSAYDTQTAFDVFLSMRIRRYPHTNLLPEIWRLRRNLTAYDAAYLALAKFLDAELLTTDEGLRKRAKRR